VLPEVRAEAACALLAAGQEAEAEQALAVLPAPERGPVVAYLLHGSLSNLLADDFARGRRALLVVRAYGTPDSVARSDRQLLRSAMGELGRESSSRHRRWLGPLVQTVGPGHPDLLVELIDLPGAPHDLVMALLAKHPPLHAEARARMADRVAAHTPPDEQLWRALARWGPREPLMAKLQAGGPQALLAARALAFAPPDPTLALAALEVGRDRSADPVLRRAALAAVERVGSASLASTLVTMIRQERDRSVGYRAYLTAIMLGGGKVALPALEAFPRSLPHRREEMVATMVGGTLWLGRDDARELALRALRSRAPLARLSGTLLLERVGRPEDARALRRLRHDDAGISGLPADHRVGAQVMRVMQLLHERGGSVDDRHTGRG
jgi:hypothetical protein